MLAKYNECVPNGAERILAMAERQAQHRQQLEASVVAGNLRAETRGQVFAFILGFAAILGGIVLIAFDKNVEGVASIITAFTALAGIFVYGRIQQRREREQKRREVREAQAQQRLPYDEP
jgi:uncharacterized membrane protein